MTATPKNPPLRRAVVHFAIDTEEAFMTTRLHASRSVEGDVTIFADHDGSKADLIDGALAP